MRSGRIFLSRFRTVKPEIVLGCPIPDIYVPVRPKITYLYIAGLYDIRRHSVFRHQLALIGSAAVTKKRTWTQLRALYDTGLYIDG